MKPKVLLAGDSISFGYGPGVIEILKDEFEVCNLPGNGGTSANLLSHVDDWILGQDFDAVHLNCGLHDIAFERDRGRNRVSIGDYRENLRSIADTIMDGGPGLSWASTTPVIYLRHRRNKPFDRKEKDVLSYNRVAAGIMADRGVKIDDLHAVVEGSGRERCIGEDGVHMTEFGNGALSRAVASFIRGMDL